MPTILVSGANRGLGLEFVRQYLGDPDARVIAGARDPASARALNALAAEASGRLEISPLDVADAASVDALARRLEDRPIDLLIANAGVYGGEQTGPGALDYDAWLRTFAVNTLGPMRLADALLANVRAGRGRKMVAVTSRMGSTADTSGGAFAYRASKAALNNAWANLAVAVKGDGVACAVLHPGWVKTDMGGANARIEAKDSIAGMRRVIEGLTLARTGGFYSYTGETIPW